MCSSKQKPNEFENPQKSKWKSQIGALPVHIPHISYESVVKLQQFKIMRVQLGVICVPCAICIVNQTTTKKGQSDKYTIPHFPHIPMCWNSPKISQSCLLGLYIGGFGLCHTALCALFIIFKYIINILIT